VWKKKGGGGVPRGKEQRKFCPATTVFDGESWVVGAGRGAEKGPKRQEEDTHDSPVKGKKGGGKIKLAYFGKTLKGITGWGVWEEKGGWGKRPKIQNQKRKSGKIKDHYKSGGREDPTNKGKGKED